MELERHFVEKPWGRTDLPAEFGAPAGKRIGEVWYELPVSAPLPLLVKWLFTSEKLSIQVHPSDAQAKATGLASGKEECWYIVDAEPGAVLGIGTKRPLSADALRAASQSGEIQELVDWKPVQAGDYFYIPAGTVHAIGAGITLVEVQQYSDITYRLYDYGRPRPLHLEEGVACSIAAPYSDPRSGRASEGRLLVDGPFFRLAFLESLESGDRIGGSGPLWVIPLQQEAGRCFLAEQAKEIAGLFKGPALIASAC